YVIFFFQAEDGIRDDLVTGVQTCALPILVRLQEETEVIGLKALGATQVARLEPGNAAAHLAEQKLLGVAREAGAGGVVRHAGAGPLIEVNRIPLREGDRRVGSRDPAQVERARDLVMPLEKAVPEVDRAHVGAPAQEVLAPLVEVAIHGREHHTDAALTIAELLLRPHHGVVGGGLHRFAEWARGALRNGIEDTDGLSARPPARQLRGSVDRGGRRRARLAVVELGRAPDARSEEHTS